jgi:hypothetical protein
MAENVVHQLIIHELILEGNFEEIERLLKSPKGPELARQKDQYGDLPLHHVAAINSSNSFFWSTIDLLLQIHPEGLKEKNQNGDLPLHIITQWVQYSSNICVATQFLRIYPEGAGVKDGHGLLPIEHAFQANRFDLVNLIAKCDPNCLALQAYCRCPLRKLNGCTDCNDKHPFMTRIRESNKRLESQKELIQNLKTAHSTSQAQVTEMQQQLDSEKQRNQTRNTENATLQAQVTEIQQQLDDNERENLQQTDGLLSLLVESGAQVIESCSNLPIPNLKYLIRILCRRLDTFLLSDGGDDRKPSCAKSLAAYLVEDANASKDMLMQCIQNLFSECAQAKSGDDHGAAGQGATTARAHTSGAARRERNDNSSPDHQGSQDDAAGSTTRKKRARVYVSPKQEQR